MNPKNRYIRRLFEASCIFECEPGFTDDMALVGILQIREVMHPRQGKPTIAIQVERMKERTRRFDGRSLDIDSNTNAKSLYIDVQRELFSSSSTAGP